MLPEELEKIAEHEIELQKSRKTLNVCMAAGCISCQSNELKSALEKALQEQGNKTGHQVKSVGCLGLCTSGPLVLLEKENIIYKNVAPSDAAEIVKRLDGQPVARLACPTDLPFYREQVKIVLENSGRIDPERIQDYFGTGGYAALEKVMTAMSPAQVVDEIVRSGLRGRGGAGFPTGLKWTTVAKTDSSEKYVICNADEGDPGAFMDRSVLESDPHRVIEGMAIAAYAVGAHTGYIYVRSEYPLAIKRLRIALKQCEQSGILGNDIFGRNYNIHFDIRLGAGAFVCGEETALIASIEGKRGMPRPRPPFPAQSGLWGKPTLINNVETFANIAPIISKGHKWFAGIGTEKSKGTKVFALAGKIVNTGLIEVPMGTPLRKIIFEIGGGIPDGKKFKAVQTGGPSGGCIPEQHLDIPVNYESLVELGSIMGSGGMIVMDETSCMVDVAKFFMEFCMTESCGKCVPCRVGTVQMHHLLEKITRGEAAMKDLDLLVELCDMVKNTSLCGLGQTAPNPVNSTLRYFRHEYMEHIQNRKCSAGVCRMSAAKKEEVLRS